MEFNIADFSNRDCLYVAHLTKCFLFFWSHLAALSEAFHFVLNYAVEDAIIES